MTQAEFGMFLLGSAILCLIMALVNALRVRARGSSALLMSGAFIAVGAGLMIHRGGGGTEATMAMGAVAFILLVADLMVRARNQTPGGPTK